MSDTFGKANRATPAATLEQQILDPNHPKSDREWWAAAEIESLRAEVTRLKAVEADYDLHEREMIDLEEDNGRLTSEVEKLRAALERAAHELELLYFFAISNGIAEAGIPPHVQARAALTQETRDE